MKMIALVLAVLAFAGCGGGSAQIDKSKLEQKIKEDASLQLVGSGSTIDSVDCVEDGDGLHFKCYVSGTTNGMLDTTTVTVTCDTSDYGTCIWGTEG